MPKSVDQVPKIKGLAFIEILRWYARTHGMQRLREAVAALPPDLRQLVIAPDRETLGLLSGSWYPAPLITCVFHHMTKDLSPAAVQRLAADAVQHSVGTTLSGVYGSIIRVLVSPKMVAEHYQKLWRLYHTTGECKVFIHSPTHQEMRMTSASIATILTARTRRFGASELTKGHRPKVSDLGSMTYGQ
jgi:hypothetical protein